MHRTSLLIRWAGRDLPSPGSGDLPQSGHCCLPPGPGTAKGVGVLHSLGAWQFRVRPSLTHPDRPAQRSWPIPMIITAAASSNLF